MCARTGLVATQMYLEHNAGLGHPERPERLEAILEGLREAGLDKRLVRIEPRPATPGEIALVHDPSYVELARREIEGGRRMLSTGDTNVCPRSYEVALLAAGGAIAAVDAVAAGKVRSAFCAVRPPGHHATPSGGMGFCIFNNAAIAARYAQKGHGVGRVLIADWDLHHGNGTQEAFYEDPTVFYFSTHEYGNYPMALTGSGLPGQTGSGEGAGTNLNCPLSAGSGDREIVAAFTGKLLPAMKTFRPELVIVSAGFDCLRGDPLGRLDVTADGIGELTRIVMRIAEESARGRIVSVLEGGYDLDALAAGATAHIAALIA